jgi:hypothetical protein
MPRGDMGGASGQMGQFAQIHQEICQNKTEQLRSYLNQKQGSDFDKAFLGQQILAHQAMIAKLEVFQRHTGGSGQAADTFRQAEQEARTHLQQAQDLMKQVDRS